MKKNSKKKIPIWAFVLGGVMIAIVLFVIVSNLVVLDKKFVCMPSCPICADCGGGYTENYTLWDSLWGR